MSARYITTTLPYVNARLHVGHAVDFVQADTLARLWRLMGHEVFFNTGVDEHGQKIVLSAEKAGEDVQSFVDRHAAEAAELKTLLSLSYDAFIRTTDEGHQKAAQEMWRRCEAAGDIYKKSYTGWYCVGCESYKTEKEIENGTCVLHGNLSLEEVTEENYFFRFSKYQDRLREYLSREGVVVPEWRRLEALAFVDGGLEDFSISRAKERLSWGIPVPGDGTQVMYVWFDALTNYISTLGWPEDASGNFARFWEQGVTLQIAGKDQVRFQSLMWQAMLMSADIRRTDTVFYHGFINSGGQKMSKTLGNVIDPYGLIERYGTDATRYLLLRHVHPTEDTDITPERLDEWYTANLVNGLGNLTARILKLTETHIEGVLVTPEQQGLPHDYAPLFEQFEFNKGMDYVWSRIQAADERIALEEPFKVIKTDRARGEQILRELAQELYIIGCLLQPVLPTTSMIIVAAVLANKKPENLFPRLT